MNCPICNKIIKHDHHCTHDLPPYTIWYDNCIDGLTTVEIYKPGEGRLLTLKGFVYLDKERIEKLLLLK